MQLRQCVHPFGEVNVKRIANGALEVKATILKEPDVENACCGLALDGSASMKSLYGLVSPLMGGENYVEPVARHMANYLSSFAGNGVVEMIYWAVEPDGSAIESIGSIDSDRAHQLVVRGPLQCRWGRGTQLLPPLKHFLEGPFRAAPWSLCLFLTDGHIDDLAAVKAYSWQVAQEIAAQRRGYVKLVLLGIGEDVCREQLAELDDMFDDAPLYTPAGYPIDLWDHTLVAHMRALEEIFAEVVTEDLIIAQSGEILDANGASVRRYREGLPALLTFHLPPNSACFSLQLPSGERFTQDLAEALAILEAG